MAALAVQSSSSSSRSSRGRSYVKDVGAALKLQCNVAVMDHVRHALHQINPSTIKQHQTIASSQVWEEDSVIALMPVCKRHEDHKDMYRTFR